MASLAFFRGALFGAVLLLAVACGKKSDPTAAANAFFDSLRKGDARSAYDRAAFSFQAQQGFADFQTTINELGLVDYATLEWTPQHLAPDEATLEGVITKRSGTNVPVAVTLVPESGEWKVFALRTAGPDPSKPTSNRFSLVGKSPTLVNLARENVPTEKESIALVQATFALIDDAMRRQDFGDLYNSMSNAWRAKFTQNRLAEVFEPMLKAGARLEATQRVEPIFDPKPYVDDRGLLVTTGYFPVQPHRVIFSLAYLYELPKWKLVEIATLTVEN